MRWPRIATFALAFAAWFIHLGSPPITKIVISLGACGDMPCASEQVAASSTGGYSYTIYPHRRAFVVDGPAFSDVMRRLRGTAFFSDNRREAAEHGNSGDITIFVATKNGNRQVTADEGSSDYAQYFAFAQFVLQPVRSNVAALRAHEQQTLRRPADLLQISVTHEPFGKCYFYDARFSQAGNVAVRYASTWKMLPLQRWYNGTLRFDRIRSLVDRNKIASLYEDYPTMGHDFEEAGVQLTYRSGTYSIDGPERQYRPPEFKTFISSIDRLIAQRLPLCHGATSGAARITTRSLPRGAAT